MRLETPAECRRMMFAQWGAVRLHGFGTNAYPLLGYLYIGDRKALAQELVSYLVTGDYATLSYM